MYLSQQQNVFVKTANREFGRQYRWRQTKLSPKSIPGANTSRRQHLLCQHARPSCQRRNSIWKMQTNTQTSKYTNKNNPNVQIQEVKGKHFEATTPAVSRRQTQLSAPKFKLEIKNKYTNIQIYKYLNTQMYKYINIQIYKILFQKNTYLQI